MRKQKGFSLIELLIVVAIILVIAAIAIPNFIRSRMAANESSAVSSLRTINTAEIAYFSTYGTGYAPLANLGGPAACVASANTACLIDTFLTGGAKSGYTISTPAPGAPGTIAAPNVIYSVNAVPIVLGSSGQRSFCSDQSGVLRNDSTGAIPANPCSTSGLNALQ
jgi:type IV pilus assembly protein PilA